MEQPKAITVEVFDSITLLEGVRVRKFEEGFVVGEAKSREKISGKTKRRAAEIQTIDRSDPGYTVKYHRVEEFDQNGNPVGEPHEHTEHFPSKRRPHS